MNGNSVLSIIVAMNRDFIIGVNNRLPWHIKEDLKHFKDITYNQTVIMGRKTFDSIGRALPNRKNIVITRNPDCLHHMLDKITVYTSLKRAIKHHPNAFVIGGHDLYASSVNYCENLYVTWVDCPVLEHHGVVKFPDIDFSVWKLKSTTSIISSAGIGCQFCHYVRSGN